ncbi:transposase [Legionella birminghamensis]|uniref:Transposase n=1 Tax=Legionella birminghamensis TaxID=28083 RepID=A0A378IA98_9GAMM|nr:transposase [Legionella birminghamensis]
MTKRAKYSKEFKLDAISLVLAQGYERKDMSARQRQKALESSMKCYVVG